MNVVKQNVIKDCCSCNFCSEGELNANKNGLVYPYQNVLLFKRNNGNGLCASICENCLDELYIKGKDLLKVKL